MTSVALLTVPLLTSVALLAITLLTSVGTTCAGLTIGVRTALIGTRSHPHHSHSHAEHAGLSAIEEIVDETRRFRGFFTDRFRRRFEFVRVDEAVVVCVGLLDGVDEFFNDDSVIVVDEIRFLPFGELELGTRHVLHFFNREETVLIFVRRSEAGFHFFRKILGQLGKL